MRVFIQQLKKVVLLTAGAVTLSTLTVGALQAAETGGASEAYLAAIKKNTDGILKAVSTLPTALDNLSKLALSWMNAEDDTDTTAKLQESFANLGDAINKDQTKQIDLQQKLQGELFGTAVTRASLPNANDVSYSSLLSRPFFSPDPRNQNGNIKADPSYNYIKNAGGVNVAHVVPGNWSGGPKSQAKYISYYNTVMSVQSYDAYLLSDMYASYINGSLFSKLQTNLITQASGSNWFAQVFSEDIGIVLRHILVYTSQSYVLLGEMLKTQKQAVAAQAMTNTLLILMNQNGESLLVQNATTPNTP